MKKVLIALAILALTSTTANASPLFGFFFPPAVVAAIATQVDPWTPSFPSVEYTYPKAK